MRKPVFEVSKQAVQPPRLVLSDFEVEGLYFVAKTKALISYIVTEQLICTFVFAYAKSRFSHDAAHTFFLAFQFRSSFCI